MTRVRASRPLLVGIVAWLIVALLILLFALSNDQTPSTAATGSAGPSVIRGADISWPNCPKGEGIPKRRSKGEPMPGTSARFVIVGLTNGPGFHPNPCLAHQLSWVATHHRSLGAYAMTTYPGPQKIRRYGGPRDAGYAEAQFNVRTMHRLGIDVPRVWVDVEPYPTFPWTSHQAANRAVVAGVIHGYRDAGYRIGIYTFAIGWREIVGHWRLPKVPTWNTVGGDGAKRALAACARGPSGGPTWVAQWWVGVRDLDLSCPDAPRHPWRA